MHKHRAPLLALCAALLWGTAAAVGKNVLVHLTHMQLLFYVTAFATLALFLIVAAQGKLPLLKTYGRRDYLRFAGMGFLGVFMYGVFLYAGLQYAPAQEAFIVNYTWPLWIAVFAGIFLREKLGARKIAALLLGFLGVCVVATNGDLQHLTFTHLKGDLLALCGAISYGLFSVLTKKHDDERVTATFLYYGFGFMYVAMFSLVTGNFTTSHLAEVAPGLVWLGAVTGGIGFICWLTALKHGDTAKLSNIILITPFLSFVYIFLLTGEQIKLSSFVGCGLIVAGILYQRVGTHTKQEQKLEATGEL